MIRLINLEGVTIHEEEADSPAPHYDMAVRRKLSWMRDPENVYEPIFRTVRFHHCFYLSPEDGGPLIIYKQRDI